MWVAPKGLALLVDGGCCSTTGSDNPAPSAWSKKWKGERDKDAEKSSVRGSREAVRQLGWRGYGYCEAKAAVHR